MNKLVLRFLKDNSGATAIEYGLRNCGRDHLGRAEHRHRCKRDV